MCGRVNVSDHEGLRSLLAMMGMQVWPMSPAQFNVPPTETLDVIMQPTDTENLQLASMRWGFAPNEKSSHRNHLFNARAETVFSKPSFRSSARKLRAIVPVNGYYEWQRNSQGKNQAFHVSDASEPTLAMAAIYQRSPRSVAPNTLKHKTKQEMTATQLSLELDHDQPENSEKPVPKKRRAPDYDVCVLTIPANEQMGRIHHRMPVLLDIGQARRWITEGDEAMLLLFTQLEKQRPLTVKRVSNFVNKAVNDGPECLNEEITRQPAR